MSLRQPYYDHPNVPGNPICEFRDALKARGWEAVVAHTGGGVMSVSVALSEDTSCLIGGDFPESTSGFMQDAPSGAVERCASGGLDVERKPGDDGEWYVGSLSFECEPGAFLDAAEDALRSVRDGSAVLH
jgi:hypothetical protein